MSGEMLLYVGLALLALAMLLIVIEVFVPSGGVIAIGAGISVVAGLVMLFKFSISWGITGSLLTMVLGPMSFFWAVNLLPSTRAGRRLIGAPTEEEVQRKQAAERKIYDERAALLGAEGIAKTDLRPVGIAEIDGQRFDVLAEGGLIEAGTRVRVTVADLEKIKVRELS